MRSMPILEESQQQYPTFTRSRQLLALPSGSSNSPVSTPQSKGASSTRTWRPPPSHTTGEFVPRIRVEAPLFNGDDPIGWIFGIQEYFNYFLTLESVRLAVVEKLIEHPASDWFRYYQQNNDEGSWEDFLVEVCHHFAPALFKGDSQPIIDAQAIASDYSILDMATEFGDIEEVVFDGSLETNEADPSKDGDTTTLFAFELEQPTVAFVTDVYAEFQSCEMGEGKLQVEARPIRGFPGDATGLLDRYGVVHTILPHNGLPTEAVAYEGDHLFVESAQPVNEYPVQETTMATDTVIIGKIDGHIESMDDNFNDQTIGRECYGFVPSAQHIIDPLSPTPPVQTYSVDMEPCPKKGSLTKGDRESTPPYIMALSSAVPSIGMPGATLKFPFGEISTAHEVDIPFTWDPGALVGVSRQWPGIIWGRPTLLPHSIIQNSHLASLLKSHWVSDSRLMAPLQAAYSVGIRVAMCEIGGALPALLSMRVGRVITTPKSQRVKIGNSIRSCDNGNKGCCEIYDAISPKWTMSIEVCNNQELYCILSYDLSWDGDIIFIEFNCRAEVILSLREEKMISELWIIFPGAVSCLKKIVNFEYATSKQQEEAENCWLPMCYRDVKLLTEDIVELKLTIFLESFYSGWQLRISARAVIKLTTFNYAYSFKLLYMRTARKHAEKASICAKAIFIEGVGLTATCAGIFVSKPGKLNMMSTMDPRVSNLDVCLQSILGMRHLQICDLLIAHFGSFASLKIGTPTQIDYVAGPPLHIVASCEKRGIIPIKSAAMAEKRDVVRLLLPLSDEIVEYIKWNVEGPPTSKAIVQPSNPTKAAAGFCRTNSFTGEANTRRDYLDMVSCAAIADANDELVGCVHWFEGDREDSSTHRATLYVYLGPSQVAQQIGELDSFPMTDRAHALEIDIETTLLIAILTPTLRARWISTVGELIGTRTTSADRTCRPSPAAASPSAQRDPSQEPNRKSVLDAQSL